MRLIPRLVAAIFTGVALSAPRLWSQQVPNHGEIRGIVVDEAGRPVPNAEALLQKRTMRVRAGDDGIFHLLDVEFGKYTIEIRRLGYKPQSVKVNLRDSLATVRVSLERLPFSLPSVVTVANRGGLSGVVADTAFKPLAQVKVQVNGAQLLAETDSAGQFFIPVKPGHYMVVLRRSGYARQTVSVTVPPDTGRQIAAWMVPEARDSDPRQGAMLFDQNQRLMAAAPASSRFFSREDFEKLGTTDLRQLASLASGSDVSMYCPVMENGDPKRTLPLWAVVPQELEFLEVYFVRGGAPRTSAGPGGSAGKLASEKSGMSRIPSSGCAVTIIAWWRK